MKILILIIGTACLAAELNSCCTKKDCLGLINEIQLLNFSKSEADSIILETFEGNSNFSNRIDSFFTSAYGRLPGDSDLIIFMPDAFDPSYDYRITILSTAQTYELTSFKIEKKTCNTCFPYHPASDYFDVLAGYLENGQVHSGSRLEIVK